MIIVPSKNLIFCDIVVLTVLKLERNGLEEMCNNFILFSEMEYHRSR